MQRAGVTGLTAPPGTQRHTGPFAARRNVTMSPEVYPSLGQHWQHSTPAPRLDGAVLSSIPEPYRPFSPVAFQSGLGDANIDEYDCEASLESPESPIFLPAQRRVTSMYLDLL